MRRTRFVQLCLGIVLIQLHGSTAVSLYEYYAPGGSPTSGLVAEGSTFTLNGKDLTILSGSFHYFRVHPAYWRETLQKIRALGFNAVQTYVPWNLHEPRQGEFDFGQLGEDMSEFLDVRGFIQMAQEEDLFVILRPGPYICAEWEFGGFPSWLLRDHTMRVRTYYEGFRLSAESFFNSVLSQLNDLQFVDGGPIISIQIENEYGSFGYDYEPRDLVYMDFLKQVIEANGFTETLLFTSDNPTIHFDQGALPGVLQTANFNYDPEGNFEILEMLQPNRPLMVSEFWTGWFDFWLSEWHSTWWVDDFAAMYETILVRGASVNLYMFIGGTNFGFMAGANDQWSNLPKYIALVTSYDYDALLSEGGGYTAKYDRVLEILSRLNPLQGIVDNPAPPQARNNAAYGNFPVTEAMDFYSLVAQAPETFESLSGTLNMEALPMNNNNGQSYGYLLYTTYVPISPEGSELMIRGHVRDMAQVMQDGTLVTQQYGNGVDLNAFGFWEGRDKSVTLYGDGSVQRIDILVENLGRINSGPAHMYIQKKGLWEGDVLLDRSKINQWTMTPFEFKRSFINGLSGWTAFSGPLPQPSLFRAIFTVQNGPDDTFLDMSAWNKGVVFVNGFNLGRYWSEGPTKTLYIPGPLMVLGENEIVVFEQYQAADEIIFIDHSILV